MIHLAIDNGPSGAAWDAMAAQPTKFAPLIRRLVGYYLMCGATEDDRDIPDVGTVVEMVMPGYVDLTKDEAYFVRAGAVQVLCQDFPASVIDDMAKAWMSEGAPE